MQRLIGISLAMSMLVSLGAREATAQRRSSRLVQPAVLTAGEKESILQLREEEKLARDVYLTLAQRWSVPMFPNIAKSEANHMAAVKQLIVKYGLVDPVVSDTVGVFKSPEFAELYNELVAAGSVSIGDAYEVGVTIEEMDIDDLMEALSEVQKADIRTVFQNLLNGSMNHLAAFQSHL